MDWGLLCVIAWVVCGLVFGFLDWTRNHDLTIEEIPLAFIGAIIGPVFLLVWAAHAVGLNSSVVLFKRRTKK